MASSTTIPGATGTRYCSVLPPCRSPRKTSKIASAIYSSSVTALLRYFVTSLPRAGCLYFVGQELLQFAGHGGNRLLAKRHSSALRGDDVILLSPRGGVQGGIIDAAVRPAALAAGQGAARNSFGNQQHRFQVVGQVPAGIEQARALHVHTPGAFVELFELYQGLLEIAFGAEDSHQLLHGLLQIAMDGVGRFAISILEWGQHLLLGLVDLRLIDGRLADFFGVLRGCHASPSSKHEQIGEGVSSQPVRAMQACR